MTKMDNGRCFGRVKARELTEEEISIVSGGGDHQHGPYHMDGPLVVDEADNDYCIGGIAT